MNNFTFYVCLGLFLALGFILGMLFQQVVIKQTAMDVAGSLEGVEINIDLNETQILEGIKETFIPIFNETYQEEKEHD